MWPCGAAGLSFCARCFSAVREAVAEGDSTVTVMVVAARVRVFVTVTPPSLLATGVDVVSGGGIGAGALRASGKLSLLQGVLAEWQRDQVPEIRQQCTRGENY